VKECGETTPRLCRKRATRGKSEFGLAGIAPAFSGVKPFGDSGLFLRVMKLPLLLVLAMGCPLALAQDTKPPAATPPPRPARSAPVQSPQLNPDGSVTFRLRAPKASEVKVSGQFGKDTALTRDEAAKDSGLWTATVPNVPAGVHEYRFVVDGLATIDPQNPWVKPQRWPNTSILHVPAQPPAPWDLQDVPHGTVHLHDYHSKALGAWRRLVVYTPPSYPKGARLPVLYLSHGYSDNEGSWTVHGKAHWILDSLIASGRAQPMVVVMPDAHPIAPGAVGFEEYAPKNSEALCDELVQDIIPLVESHYRVASKPESRAFAGLSMGGHHAFTVALNHHDRFHWIGAFSAAPPKQASVAAGLDASKAVNQHLRLLWVACGTKDFLIEQNRSFHGLLEAKSIRHEYVETEGDHSWPVWRRYMVDFVPRLFRTARP
jgi:enterochelin esterase family protein